VVRVVICDDAKVYGLMLAAQLRDDAEIEVAAVTSSVEECLVAVARDPPDVVVLDHLLPGGDSSVVIPLLRERAPGVAVVLVSGLPAEVIAQTAAEVGAEAAVSKASTQGTVRAAILRAALS
jgi:DNA-binding NarL/FixJ family response regulator